MTARLPERNASGNKGTGLSGVPEHPAPPIPEPCAAQCVVGESRLGDLLCTSQFHSHLALNPARALST